MGLRPSVTDVFLAKLLNQSKREMRVTGPGSGFRSFRDMKGIRTYVRIKTFLGWVSQTI